MAVSAQQGGANGHEDPKVGWKNRVKYADQGNGAYAYKSGDVVTTTKGAEELLRNTDEPWFQFPSDQEQQPWSEDLGPCTIFHNVKDPLLVIAELRVREVIAQPNHVLFLHCDCCPPHPASGMFGGFGGFGFNPASINPASINPASINPASINPASINPASINPASINPASINPASINPGALARVTGLRRSSARPVEPLDTEAEAMEKQICSLVHPEAPSVIVLDTGLARTNPPSLLAHAHGIHAAEEARIDEPDNDQNLHLDPAAGHGTFIAGIVKRVAPGCRVTLGRVASMYGDADEQTAARAIFDLLTAEDENGPIFVPNRTILNLSFGGYTMSNDAILLAWAVREFQSRGGVVVASAGNDSSCRRTFPAALPDVVSVGAVGPWGPAPFTNYGPWVKACAPGVDLTSMFFKGFQGKGGVDPEGIDPDNFDGWARWSGTSFSAPVVAGALGRVMMWSGCTAQEAVKEVVEAPELMRIPNLGTVVNASLTPPVRPEPEA